MAPRKRAAKKKADTVVQQQVPEEKWDHPWPKEVVEKHALRQQALKAQAALRAEQKHQRMINNGVPSEKRSI